MKLLFVVHRYGYPGGSEVNTQRMAEAALVLGHDVTVLADTNTGDLNGVKVTKDRHIAFTPFDIIIVHGSCPTQDFIHMNAWQIPSPIYYIIIQPSDSEISQIGMRDAKWIGCGTSFDWEHVKKYGHEAKGRQFIYGINPIFGNSGFKEKLNIKTKKMFLSAGGFWPHKQFDGIVNAFNRASPLDTTLVLLGYDTRNNLPLVNTDTIKSFVSEEQQHVFNAMREADLYIFNSLAEGYGLVLLESMYNLCPWVARPIAAGYDLAKQGYGVTYNTEDSLVDLMLHYETTENKKAAGFEYVMLHHLAIHSINSILGVLQC